MTIQEHIDELKAELQSALDTAERRQIEAELEQALAKRETIVVGQKGHVSAEPPS